MTKFLTLGLIGLAFILGAPSPAAAEPRVIHSEKSLYRNLFITEDGDVRCLTFRRALAGTRQTCITLKDPLYLYFPYARMMMGSLYLNPDPKRILIVGLGGGTLPMALRDLLPDAEIDVVEIDQAVVKAARDYFYFKDDPKMKVYVQDGRVFVKRAQKASAPYDLIMLDAFEDDYIPEHLLSKEFLEEVKSIMTPGGILAANTFSGSGLYPHESATYASVFGKFYNLRAANRVIWAQNGELVPRAVLEQNAAALNETLEKRGVNQSSLLLMLDAKQDWDQDTRILTDQYSPSNILNSRDK
jgi:spermidine synthase